MYCVIFKNSARKWITQLHLITIQLTNTPKAAFTEHFQFEYMFKTDDDDDEYCIEIAISR